MLCAAPLRGSRMRCTFPLRTARVIVGISPRTPVMTSEAMFQDEGLPEFSARVGTYTTGAMTNLMISLGDSMGLFRCMAVLPPSTPDELALAAGKHERWIREWLHQLAAARVVSTDKEAKTFWLTEAQTDVLAREVGTDASPAFTAGTCAELAWFGSQLPKLEECFRTGVGMSYDAYGKELTCGICRMLGTWTRHRLLHQIKSMPGLDERLRAGITVADLGCGAGLALCILAREYSASTFHGYDLSSLALDKARADAEGLPNAAFYDPSTPDGVMGQARYDFMLTLDAVHDMAHPDSVTRQARQALREGAYGWLIGDFQSRGSPAANIREMGTGAAIAYGYSVMLCMSSGLSEPGGTLGWHAELAVEMLKKSGFSETELLVSDGIQFYLAHP